MKVDFYERLERALLDKKATITFTADQDGGIRALVSTPPAASVRRRDISTESPPMVRAEDALHVALNQHEQKLRSTRDIARELGGKKS